MDIAPYIQEYLSQHEQVSLPGFGRFIRRRMQGYFDQQTGTLHPPRQRLEIVGENSPTDDLVHFISEKKKISGPAARYFIDQFVQTLKNELSQGDTQLTGIGTISASGEGYTLKTLGTFPENGFGLLPVSVNEPVVQPLSIKKIPVKTAPEEAELVTEETRSPGIPNGVWVLFVLLVFALSGGMTWYYHPEWFSPEKPAATVKTPVKTAPAVKPAPVVVPADTTAGVPADSVAKDSSLHENAGDPADSVTASGVTLYAPQAFEIIGASFKTVSAAQEQVKRFGWKNVKAKMLKNTRGKRIKISLGSFKDETAARMELERLRAELNNKEIFIEPYSKR